MQSRAWFMAIVLLLACATKMTADIYTPSMITIAHTLPGASVDAVQISLTLYLFGVSCSQLVFGPVSEGIGRKRPLTYGLLIFIMGSIWCAVSTSMAALRYGQLLQGLGAGALSALWRAVLRDVLHGEALARYSASLFILMVLVFAIAPILGGYFDHMHWRCSFVFLALYALVALGMLHYSYQETNIHYHPDKLRLPYILGAYRLLLTNRLFVGISLCMFLSFGSVFSWIIIAPALLIKGLGLTPMVFGWVIALTSTLGYALGTYLHNRYLPVVGVAWMMRIGWVVMMIVGMMMWLGYYLWGLTMWGLIIPIGGFYIGCTLIWPNAFSTAFTPFGHMAGYAGSLYGCMQLGGGAIVGSCMAYLPDTDQRPLAACIFFSACLAYSIYQYVVLPAVEVNSLSS